MPLHCLVIHGRRVIADLVEQILQKVLGDHIGTLGYCATVEDGFDALCTIQPSLVFCDIGWQSALADRIFADPNTIEMIAPFIIINIGEPQSGDSMSLGINAGHLVQLAFRNALMPPADAPSYGRYANIQYEALPYSVGSAYSTGPIDAIDRLVINTGSERQLVRIADIVYCEAYLTGAKFVLASGRAMIANQGVKAWSVMLENMSPSTMVQISRDVIVNVDYVEKTYFENKHLHVAVRINNSNDGGESFKVSRNYRHVLDQRINARYLSLPEK